jgi:hypothetical protein
VGWWKTVSGSIIGDSAADYVTTFCKQGIVWNQASELPREIRDRLDALYVEGIGRPARDAELTELLDFAGG